MVQRADYNIYYYRIYSAVLTFAGLIAGVWHFKRETRRAEDAVFARERCGSLRDTNPKIGATHRPIVDSLLFFARDASADPFAPADLDQILEATLELCRQRFAEHEIELRVIREESRPTSIECRAGELSQVLVNLLSNAHDAVMMQDERWVRLEVVMRLPRHHEEERSERPSRRRVSAAKTHAADRHRARGLRNEMSFFVAGERAGH